MKTHSIFSRRRLHTLAIVAALVVPAAAGGPLFAQEAAAFSESFAAIPQPTRDFTTPAGAVDITAIEVPVEVQPEAPIAVRTLGSGIASYYGKRFAGRRTANGERFNPRELTAAHKTLPFGTRVLVTNPRNGKAVTVRINDRGPYAHGRTIDLSRAAAEEIGLVQRGHGQVELALLD